MRPIASDYNETYSSHPELHGEVDFVITGKNWDKFDEIDADIPVFFNPGKEELMDIVAHKANILSKTNAQKFYEDQPLQIKLLQAMVPNCRIVQVRNGLFGI